MVMMDKGGRKLNPTPTVRPGIAAAEPSSLAGENARRALSGRAGG